MEVVLIVIASLLALGCVILFMKFRETSRRCAEIETFTGMLRRDAEMARQDAANQRAYADDLTNRLYQSEMTLSQFKEESVRRISDLKEVHAREVAAMNDERTANELNLRKQLAELSADIVSAETKLQSAEKEIAAKEGLLKAKDQQLEESRRQTQELLRQQEERFKNLANEILDSNTRRFNESSQQRINDLLNPLKENLELFRNAVNDTYSKESRERFSLQQEIQRLLELNQSIGKEARDLTRALTSNAKMQGDWGEMILEQLLEKSGLRKGEHYEEQVTRNVDGTKLVSEDGHGLRADVVVYYPDSRCIVIDSKTSLTAFIEYVNLADDPDDADGSRRAAAGQRHLQSVKSHIAELARTNYQDLIGEKKMDFVLMFIPNEAAYIAAMQLEPGLWQEAYDKRVLMASPTQLISVLRLLQMLWKQDAVNKNVEEIARLSGTMIDKFSGMMDSFDDLAKSLDNAQKAYTTTRNRLSEGAGNVFVTAKKIQELGARSKKRLPEK